MGYFEVRAAVTGMWARWSPNVSVNADHVVWEVRGKGLAIGHRLLVVWALLDRRY